MKWLSLYIMILHLHFHFFIVGILLLPIFVRVFIFVLQVIRSTAFIISGRLWLLFNELLMLLVIDCGEGGVLFKLLLEFVYAESFEHPN